MMQNILDSFLHESRGFFGRTTADRFINKSTGEELRFNAIAAYPEAKHGGYPTHEDMIAIIPEVEKQLGSKIQWVNAPKKQHRAFAIAELIDSENKYVYWGRYINLSKPVMTGVWGNDEIPAGWEWVSKSREKNLSGYKPSDLIKSPELFTSAGAILEHIKPALLGVENGEVLFSGLEQSANGQFAVFPGMAEKMPAIRDYFGEIMTPLYLLSGQLGGPAEDARATLLDTDWTDCGVRWPMSQTEGLVDSYIVAPSGRSMGISSKGASGANASIKNLMDGAKRMKENNPEAYENIKETADMLIGLESSGIKNALTIGVRFDLLSQNAADTIMSFIKSGKKDFKGIPDELKELMKQKPEKVAAMRNSMTNPLFNTGFAILSIVADLVAEAVNTQTSFPEQAVEILNASAMMQVYCDMTVKGRDAVVTGYRPLYPPRFKGRVLLDSGKVFMSTGNKGNFTFKFKPA